MEVNERESEAKWENGRVGNQNTRKERLQQVVVARNKDEVLGDNEAHVGVLNEMRLKAGQQAVAVLEDC